MCKFVVEKWEGKRSFELYRRGRTGDSRVERNSPDLRICGACPAKLRRAEVLAA